MTKKHFEAIAAALTDIKRNTIDGPFALTNPAEIWEVTCNEIAIICRQFNSNFDRARFIAACRGDKT